MLPARAAEYAGGICLRLPTRLATNAAANSGSSTRSGTSPVRTTVPAASSVSVPAPNAMDTR